MAAPRILIVEDDEAVRELLRFVLHQHHFEVHEAGDAKTARNVLAKTQPSVILMDWMLPGMSGIELTKILKADKVTQQIPIIVLTAKGEEADKVRGLNCGADDYVTKPFSPRELIARIRAVIRRTVPHEGDEPAHFRGLSLDPIIHQVTANGEALELGPTEFRLLHFFLTHPDRVYSRAQLLDWVWGANSFVEERTVDVYVRRLRGALENYDYAQCIKTVRGVGYQFATARATTSADSL